MARRTASLLLGITLLLAAPAHAAGGPFYRRPLDGPWVVKTGVPGDPAGTFHGLTVRVPYVPNARDVTSLAVYRGAVAWYRTDFHIDGGDYAIRFESVNHRARVWVDGREVARHIGGYLPFEARVPLSRGAHRLVVRADWRDPARMRRDGWFRSWFNYGGINREVTITRLRPSELDAPGVTTQLQHGTPVVTVTARVRNRTAARAVQVEGRLGDTPLRFPAVRLARNATAWVTTRVRMPGAKLWWPRRAALYDLRLSVPGETGYAVRVGLREVTTRGGRLYVNGRHVILRGAAIQEDVRGRGDALTGADMDAMVARLQQIGANATRAQHGLSPALLERLDAAGILVWQGVAPFDVPGRWNARTPADRALALRRVRLDVLNARIHPSILAWNLVNEISGNGAARAQRDHVIQAAAMARRLDPGRPIAVDVWGTHLPDHAGALYAAVDAVGVTNYEGWYANIYGADATLRANTQAWLARVHQLFPGKVVAVTEFGGEANHRNPVDAPGGLQFQARLLDRHITAYRADPRLSGMIVWSLQDFALRPNFLGGSVRGLAPAIVLQRGINAKGLFSYGGRPKPAAALVERRYRAIRGL